MVVGQTGFTCLSVLRFLFLGGRGLADGVW